MESPVTLSDPVLFDYGRSIGVAVTRNGERRAVKVENPFWPEIDAEWQKGHSNGR